MGKGKKKEKKDSNAPKRAITAFFFFQSERRPELKKEKPELDNKQIISEMSAEWKKMTEKELLSLKKSELLEIMLAQSREIDSLRAQLEEAKAELANKRINIEQSGSIAEASLKLTRIFEEAQKAADLYLENVRKMPQYEK